MSKIGKYFIFGIISLLVFGAGFELWAQESSQKGKEDILFMEIPTVVASSKREQILTEAASSIAVVTSKDIKNSGATNLGDVLRSIAGIDIRETHVSQHVIGIRGFCDTAHVLVTIDGNNVFMYHANHIFLDWAPIDLEEVDRIEIVKGPGAIFYGGSAFSGIINIISKTPKQLKGTQVNVVGGNWDTIRGNIIHAGSYKSLDYSLSAGLRRAKEWESPKIPQERGHFNVNHFSGNMIYNFNDKSSLSFMARYSRARNVISRVCNPDTTFISLRYDQPNFWVRFFYNYHSKTFWNDTFSVDDSNYELEFLHYLRWGKNITSFGGYAKHTSWEVGGLKGPNTGLKEKHNVDDYAINFENEFHLNERLIFVLGGRLEHYSLLDFMGLGRGSIIYKIQKNQNIRFSIANGYYIPSLFQHTNQGTVYPFALGSFSLKKEKILSYELSYYNMINDRIKLNASIFYNTYQDLIDNTQSGPTKNVADAYQYGGELEFDFILTDWLSGFVNYAYQHIHRDDFEDFEVDPEHKFNLGLRTSFDKWSANLFLHYVNKYYEIYLTSNPVFGLVGTGPSKVDSYITANACIAYNIHKNLELAIAAYNLFNNRHYESNTLIIIQRI